MKPLEELETRLCLSAISFIVHELDIQFERRLDHVELADLDADGDQDVLMSARREVYWQENLGDNKLSAPKPISIIGGFLGHDPVFGRDLDADGDLDAFMVAELERVATEREGSAA